ncbi:MAG: bifunctional transcriptional activator/DNA repair enzyme AdaA [Betaproteobacteria bacterium]|jgi:AraC family transcriptional regulator of adaptative response/methylated-DNA-[protein]-cysteine methyltransferase|uniref:methylated-DNA--[protein]-cysteine S-methyltransferase n=1 Tax=freshwater metagenome TaxID=449393 RepID=A0A6J6GFR3_9ZZZZ
MNAMLPLLPPRDEMIAAMLTCNAAYEGVFFTAVVTTRIFCRPTCTARKPLPRNVIFYATASEAEEAGFRPCLRCRPLQLDGECPAWLRPLMDALEVEPDRRWTFADVETYGIAPARVRAWFKQRFGTTFSEYTRARRLGLALDRLKSGAGIDDVAMESGFESVSGFRDAFQKTFGVPPGKADERKVLYYRHLTTPLGPMLAMAEASGVVLLEFCDRPALPRELEDLRHNHGYAAVPGDHPNLRKLEGELSRYFNGHLVEFSVPIFAPGTAFDGAVWEALSRIPYGATRSYAELAQAIGHPTAVRAVAGANGRNRLAILLPCHRVIASDGGLGGYGGGTARKAFLLKLERQQAASEHDQSTKPKAKT